MQNFDVAFFMNHYCSVISNLISIKFSSDYSKHYSLLSQTVYYIVFRSADIEFSKDYPNLVTFTSSDNLFYGLNFSHNKEAGIFFGRVQYFQNGA